MKKQHTHPTSDEIKNELNRIQKKHNHKRNIRNVICVLLATAGVIVLLSNFLFPVLHIKGNSMEPTLKSGQIVVALKNTEINRGDMIAFYYNNQILLKRVVGLPNERIELYEDGTVAVNGNILSEPYITEKSFGECNLQFPYKIPDGEYFVMGDNRETSIDSRSDTVGCISKENIIGKLIICVWPLDRMSVY
jgi:signal peptidase I